MTVRVEVDGYGYELARTVVKATGSRKEVIEKLAEESSDIESDPGDADEHAYGFTDYTIKISDEDGNVLYEDEDCISDDATAANLEEDEYSVEYESEEKGTWIDGEIDIDDEEFEKLKKSTVEKFSMQDDDDEEVVREVFGNMIEFQTETVTGMNTVGTGVSLDSFGGLSVGDGLSTEGKSLSVSVYDSNGEDVDLEEEEEEEE